MGRKINPRAIDITKPWMTKLSECKDIDPNTLTRPFNKADFMRKPRKPQLRFPGERNGSNNKQRETS